MKLQRIICLFIFAAVVALTIFQYPLDAFSQYVRPPTYPQPEQVIRDVDGWGTAEWRVLFSGGLFLIAACALIYAIKTVRVAQRQTEATILFELETRWTSNRINEGREILGKIDKRVSTLIRPNYPGKTEEKTKEKIQRGVTICIYAIRKNNLNDYRKIHSIIEFFETMGVFIYVLKGLSHDSVAQLLAGAIEGVGRMTRRYIVQWQQKDPGVFIHALTLFDETDKWLETQRRMQRP